MKKILIITTCIIFYLASLTQSGCGSAEELPFSISDTVSSAESSSSPEGILPKITETFSIFEAQETAFTEDDTDSVDSSPAGRYIAEDAFGNRFVNIPEDTVLITYDGDPSQTFSEMAGALAARTASVCVKNQYLWYDTTDFYAMPYSTFWLKDCSGTGVTGQTSLDEERASYHFYQFTYYDLNEEELAGMKAEIDAAASEIISLVPEDADDWTKARIVHDELCRLITYDETTEASHCHDTYGALVNHLAVCSGYSCAFSHIMSMLGNYCPLSYSDEHAWNFVAVPSDQVYIDTTWDDTDLTDAYGDPYIDYSYFFLTREEVESIDAHSITSFDPLSSPDNPQPYNYYAHEGFLVDSYDADVILEMLCRQYETGSNLLTIRFANEEDYQRALLWKENDSAEMQDLLAAAGYYGTYYYWMNDAMRTVSFGLYASAE